MPPQEVGKAALRNKNRTITLRKETRPNIRKGHKGVKDWWGPGSSAATSDAKSAAPKTPEPAATAASGGGPGLVWVNSESKVYHCPGDRWYGKTKQGSYMSESDAVAKGNHADHGKSCK